MAGGALRGPVALLLLLPVLTRVHRHRLRVTAGIAIPPHPKGQYRWPSWRAVAAAARSQAAWRQVGYHLLAAPALAVAAMVAIGTWLASLVYALVYVYAWALPAGSLLHRGLYRDPSATHLPVILGLQVDVWLTLGGRRGAVRRAVAHRRGPGARRQGGPGAARPEPRRGA